MQWVRVLKMKFELLILMVLILASAEDFFHKEISLWMPVICGIISFSCIFTGYLNNETDLVNVILSLLPGAALLLVALVTGQAIGYGDGLMALTIAPVLGFEKTCIVILAGMMMSLVYSIFLLIVRQSDKKATFAFVPFLAAGMGVTILAEM